MAKRRIGLSLLLALFAFAVAPSGSAADGVSLTIKARGAKPGKGQAICSLFSSRENYLKSPVRQRTQPIGASGEVACRFDELSAGRYAVSVVYDEDNDGQLDTGFMGIPKEKIGMSNNAKGLFGPPSFEQASFLLSRPRTIEVILGNAGE